MRRAILSIGSSIILAASLGLAAPASADQIISGTYGNDGDPDNSAVFNGVTWDLSSQTQNNVTTYSYVDYSVNQYVTLSQLTNLSVNFTDNAGGAYGGSPRVVLSLSNGGFITVYLGPSPNFIETDANQFTIDYSGLNLNSSVKDATYENGNTLGTLHSFYATYGQYAITNIYLIVDGGWAEYQDLTMDSIDAEYIPEPGSLALLGAGIVGLGALRRRKKTKPAAG